jgi:hypothetical protein
MKTYQQPDGAWVTTPILIGGLGKVPVPCAACQWQDVGLPSSRPPRVQMQRCPQCGAMRGRYIDDPREEVKR